MKQDLSRRFNRFKVSDDTLASMKQMRDARQKNLDAAHQKLSAMINARRKLDVDVQNLEAKRKLVEVAQASSDYVFDDSQLARAKELITDIRTRLDVAAKLANADVNVQTEIPLNDSAPADITDQVTEYFKLDGKHRRQERHRQAGSCEARRHESGAGQLSLTRLTRKDDGMSTHWRGHAGSVIVEILCDRDPTVAALW